MIRKLFLAILLIACYGANAQSSWQWGKRGGSSTASSGGGSDETMTGIATDPHGNIYVLSDVWTPGLDIDGHAKAGYGSSDILLSSFKCDGTYRWSKIIGGNQRDISVAVKTDTLGGVYISGYLATSASSLYIDADSSWAGGARKSLFIAKFDTSGTYKWFRMPQADTVTSSSLVASYDLDVDGAGNIYWFCALTPGAYAGGAYVVTSSSSAVLHVLKYNSGGIFQSGVQLPISFSLPSPYFKMKRDHINGRFYITGNWGGSTSGATFGTTPLTKSIFIGAFNSSGSLLWVKQNSNVYGMGFERADVDKQHNVYVTGSSVTIGVSDTFNGYPIINTIGIYHSVPFVVKLDTEGNNVWAKNGASDAATYGRGVVVNGSEIVATGVYPGKFKWVGYADSLINPSGCGYSPFITRFNAATGAILKLDSLESACGWQSEVTGIAADKSGNFYIGGYFTGSLTVTTTTLSSAGGGSDFFVAKYGTTNCGCTLPTANFTSTGTHTVNYTYSGTTGYDSLRWDFGDGGTSTLPNPSHYFGTAGTYTVCVTVYNSCGNNVYCQTITISNVGINEISASLNNVNIYPNPVTEQLIVDNLQTGTTIRLYNIMGQQVYSTVANEKRQTISTQKLPPGSYVIQLIDSNGNMMNKTIIKQ